MARALKSLPLHEEVALLALRNDRGTVDSGVMYAQAAGGALLAELLLGGQVRTVTEGRKSYVVIGSGARTGNEVLDECLDKITNATRRATLGTWVQRFSNLRKLHHRVAASLVGKGVLQETEDRVLLIFTRRAYPEVDPTVERGILSRLEQAIFTDAPAVDARTTVLLAIANHAGLLKVNFDKKQLKTRRARIDAIIKGDAIGKATKEAIEAMQAAIMMVAIMPAIVASSS